MGRLNTLHRIRFFLFVIFPVILFCSFSYALDSDEVLVVANQNASKSYGLAKFYMEKRRIPEKNLVVLFMTDKETCTRHEYEKKVIPPVRRALKENRIAATIGPVGEPYVQAFPVPDIFFKYLTEGYLTLVESYIISLPYLSWKMVLVGDPLYRVNLKT